MGLKEYSEMKTLNPMHQVLHFARSTKVCEYINISQIDTRKGLLRVWQRKAYVLTDDWNFHLSNCRLKKKNCHHKLPQVQSQRKVAFSFTVDVGSEGSLTAIDPRALTDAISWEFIFSLLNVDFILCKQEFLFHALFQVDFRCQT